MLVSFSVSVLHSWENWVFPNTELVTKVTGIGEKGKIINGVLSVLNLKQLRDKTLVRVSNVAIIIAKSPKSQMFNTIEVYFLFSWSWCSDLFHAVTWACHLQYVTSGPSYNVLH